MKFAYYFGLFAATTSFYASHLTANESTHQPNKCLRTFLTRLNDDIMKNIGDEELFLDSIEAAAQLEKHNFSPEEKLLFRASYRIAPLLENRLLELATAAELKSRGIFKPNDIREYLKRFSILSPEIQISFIERILDRMYAFIPASFDEQNIFKISEYSKKLNLTESEFTKFVKRWNFIKDQQYDELQMAILLKLLGENKKFTSDVSKHGHWFFSYFKERKNNPLKHTLKNPNLESQAEIRALGLPNSYDIDGILENYPKPKKAKYISDHATEFNLSELASILERADHWNLPEQTIVNLSTRLELIKTYHQRNLDHLELLKKEAELEKNIQVTKQMIGNPEGELQLVPIFGKKEMDKSSYEVLIEKMLSASKYDRVDQTLRSIKNMLNDKTLEQLSSDQFIELIIIPAKKTSNFPTIESVHFLIHEISGFAQKFLLTAEQISKIKKILIDKTSNNFSASAVEETFKLLENIKGADTANFKSPEEIEKLKSNVLKKAQEQLKLQLADKEKLQIALTESNKKLEDQKKAVLEFKFSPDEPKLPKAKKINTADEAQKKQNILQNRNSDLIDNGL